LILSTLEKHLWEIAPNSNNQVVDRRGALAEIHHTEKTLSVLYDVSRYLSASQLTGVNNEPDNRRALEGCSCRSTGTVTHSKYLYCLHAWCPVTLNQDWCPNPDCSHGVKGNHFRPYDEHFEWVQCSTCERWFKTAEILAVHPCFITLN
jgi:hypothetical protein